MSSAPRTEAPPAAIGPGSVVGFVGLGHMGLPMAGRLRAAGHEVRAFDTSGEACAGFSTRDGDIVSMVREVALGATLVILMLPTSEAVREVLMDGGVLGAATAGTTIVDMGSSEPLQTQALAERAAVGRVRFVDAPVSGGVRGAIDGSLTIMAGGSPADVERCRPVFDVLGDRVVHAGPVGTGHALKALNNLLSAISLLASVEVVEVGRRFGLDPHVMLDAVNESSGRSFSTEVKLPQFVLTETFDSGFGLGLMAKDMRTAVRLAEELDMPFSLGKTATALWERAQRHAPADADHTEIACWVAAELSRRTSR